MANNALFPKADARTETEWLQNIFFVFLEGWIRAQPALWHKFIWEGKVGLRMVGGVVVARNDCLVDISNRLEQIE